MSTLSLHIGPSGPLLKREIEKDRKAVVILSVEVGFSKRICQGSLFKKSQSEKR